jgi:2,5-diamino-6-(ribosylamino)-4(3H)-pyrimidinone 5'-phosphate reductase
MLPRVILHSAVSVDGRIDWFTPNVGMYYELASRWNEDATLAGADTLLAAPDEVPEDDAQAEPPAVDPEDRRPLLVVPDSKGRIRSWDYWRTQPYWRDAVVLCSHDTPQSYLDYLLSRKVDYIKTGRQHVDLQAALEELNIRYGVKTVRVDSGGTLNGALLRAGVVTDLSVMIHPALVGGTSARSLFRAPDLTSADGVLPLRLAHVEQMEGGIVWLQYEVVRQDS